MSVTVLDLMLLPSLRGAEVVGGVNGLSKIVSSISVLESVNPEYLTDVIFPSKEFFGSEIVITGFLNILHNVDMQGANMRRLAEGGEVGLILFYVGYYLPCVDQRLIDLANELDFVLICMPKGDISLRYSEVLCDVMECIYRDRLHSEALVAEILGRVAKLPKHQQSIDTILKMVSDRISASVVLTDSSHNLLNLIAWPRSLEPALKARLETLKAYPPINESAACSFLPNAHIYRNELDAQASQKMELLLIKEGLLLDNDLLEGAADVVRLSVSIWGENHGDVALHELVRAILQDEPIKMRRLAELFRIDVAAIHDMLILHSEKKDFITEISGGTGLRELLAESQNVVFFEPYEGCLLLFLKSTRPEDVARQAHELRALAAGMDAGATITRYGNLQNTTEVRGAYLCHRNYIEQTRQVFPLRFEYDLGELQLISECKALIEQGEAALDAATAVLNKLKKQSGELDLCETLAIYMLDSQNSVTQTAKVLYLHINTVKYRIHKIRDILGFSPDKMPEQIALYRALALWRMTK